MLSLRSTVRELRAPGAYVEELERLQLQKERMEYLLKTCEVSRSGRNTLKRKIEECTVGQVLLKAGFEPTTPPVHWYSGHFRGNMDDLWWSREWPSADFHRNRYFRGPVPHAAMDRYRLVKKIGVRDEDIAIYSPDTADFQIVSVGPDPVMIARIREESDQLMYFEVARWDLAKDLQYLNG